MTERLQPGTPVYHWNDAGEVLDYTEDGKLRVQLDHHRHQDEKGQGKVVEVAEADVSEVIEVVQLAPREHFMTTTEPGVEPPYSPFGYVVTEDGKVHTLLQQWCHGIVLALLFPEHAKAAGYRQPDRDSCVFHYQRYELDYHDDLPVVRIAFGVLSSNAMSKGYKPATEAQVTGARLAFKAVGVGMRDEVSCDYRDMPLSKALEDLLVDRTPEEPHELAVPEEYRDV